MQGTRAACWLAACRVAARCSACICAVSVGDALLPVLGSKQLGAGGAAGGLEPNETDPSQKNCGGYGHAGLAKAACCGTQWQLGQKLRESAVEAQDLLACAGVPLIATS